MLKVKDICDTAKCYLKGKINREKVQQANIEGTPNRLHYRATVIFLLGFSIVITCFEYIEKISCILAPNSKIPIHVINTYCFIQTTFTLPKHLKTNGELPLGIGVHNPGLDETKYHAYYQWVPFVLFLQAAMFYFPHLVLKFWDGEKMIKITGAVQK